MHNAHFQPSASNHYEQLQSLFNSLDAPYGQGEIVRFNLLYQRIYGELSRDERRHAEKLVDELIEGVEKEELKPRIYGVV